MFEKLWQNKKDHQYQITFYSVQSETVHFIQISPQKTQKYTFLISCNTYSEKGTTSITKEISSLSQTDPTNKKVEQCIGTALTKHRNVLQAAIIDQKSNIHKVTCSSDSDEDY